MVDLELVGADELARWAKMETKNIETQAVKAINSTGKKLVDQARVYRTFNDITGDSRRSITADIEHKKGQYASLSFFIDPKVGSVLMDNGYNRAWMLNDGTYEKYSQGLISPSANTVGAVQGRSGLKHYDFMGRSWKLHIPKLEKRLEQIFIRLK